MADKKQKFQNVNPRLKEAFLKKGLPELMKKLDKQNINSVPKVEKVVINVGVSQARENIKALDTAADEIGAIAGQKVAIRRAKKSVSSFKLREGMPIGVSVTLRGARMYEFLDRLITVAIPRIRDFQGLNPKAFDGAGNYNMGLKEQYIFPEVNVDKSDATRGMNITFVTSTKSDNEAFELLNILGIPFAKKKTKQN